MENSFDRLINRLDIANEKSVRLKIGQQKLSQIKYKKEKNETNHEKFQKVYNMHNWNARKRRDNKAK